ncbi:MAG: hypothetical protein H0T51_22910 [Pirellulales bacterium]|nr:hypothetical protein [Pirellulales bacterium]
MHNRFKDFRFAGRVRIWKDGDKWKWCPEDDSAPLGAKIADRYLGNVEDVIYLKHSGQEGQYIHGAVKAE